MASLKDKPEGRNDSLYIGSYISTDEFSLTTGTDKVCLMLLSDETVSVENCINFHSTTSFQFWNLFSISRLVGKFFYYLLLTYLEVRCNILFKS